MWWAEVAGVCVYVWGALEGYFLNVNPWPKAHTHVALSKLLTISKPQFALL